MGYFLTCLNFNWQKIALKYKVLFSYQTEQYMTPKPPKHIEVEEADLESILDCVKPHVTSSQYKILERLIGTFIWLQFVVRERSISIARLSQMFFGKKTESLKNLKERIAGKSANSSNNSESAKNTSEKQSEEASDSSTSSNSSQTTASNGFESAKTCNASEKQSEEEASSSSSITSNPNGNPIASSSDNFESPENCSKKQSKQTPDQSEGSNNQSNNTENSSSEDRKSSEKQASEQETQKKRNHGRRPLDDFDVSKIIHIPHNCLEEGQKCPLCHKGTLYHLDPEIFLVIRGQPPLKGEAYSAQGLRCNLCQKVFRATFPKEVATQPRADMSARAIVCLAKYQLGTPLYRLETWQKLLRLPISDAEMWEWTESVALVLFPIHQTLLKIAAKGQVLHNDDTTGKILELMEENRLVELAKKSADEQERKDSEKHRKGIFTTVLLSKVGDQQVVLYITGRKNAGENMDTLLDLRPKDLKIPIQACDASAQNSAERHKTEMAKCFNHARHNFCELVEVWPNEALAIVEMCNAVFMNDRETKKMDPEERLKYHQKHSTLIMNNLKIYCNSLIDEKKVEPNSSFGKAIKYVNNHWEGLTLILRDGEAPLSNNDCERAIKSSVLIRKNSYFYKTCWGAFIGDTLLSIIRTCDLNGINPYEYLMAVQANYEDIKKIPDAWLPWNYTQNASSPCVNVHHIPEEEIYHPSQNESPISIPRKPQPHFEDNKESLRERARDFFKRLYPEKWREKWRAKFSLG
jgi:transposase